MPRHSARGRYGFIAGTVIIGMLIVLESLWRVSVSPPGFEWFVLAILTLLTGSFTVRVPSLSARLSVSETFVFTSVLLFGPSAGTVTVVLDSLVISFWMDRRKRTLRRILFNATAPAIAIRIASEVFFFWSGARPGQIHRNDIAQLIAPVFAFALLYFLINTLLVARALVIERGGSLQRVWYDNFPVVSINYFVGSSIAMLIVAYTDQIDLTVVSIIVPLLFISYLTFRTSMGRVEDAERHIAQVNELYLSTVETLAMAVDAKDQITHGHIRRVQTYAVELAKRLGVTDPQQLNAIEVAALLHDMGKIAIPEHILNKPGKLTTAEFDRMKTHADIGADLLSSIKFPYPVVPIVRYHHEYWNGQGYPSGISRTDIPLGARILAVVDCFDALNSDRPYRPRLSVEEAFRILRERRDIMYDPLVVDTFIEAYEEIAPAAINAGRSARTLIETEGPHAMAEPACTSPLQDIRASTSESSLLIECRGRVLQADSTREALNAAALCLRQLAPSSSVFVLYRYNAELDLLTCQHVVGDPKRLLDGFRITMGERITGWCASTQQTAVNSDASLDLAKIAAAFRPILRSAISTPLVTAHTVWGVLTAYAATEDAFTELHRYAFEQVASALAERLRLQEHSTPARNIVAFSTHKA